MGNYKLDFSEWLARFPLAERYRRYSGDIITSPAHLCNNEQLRAEVLNQMIPGPAVPMDIFVIAEGEPPDRHVTKIGGLPYRPADVEWPLSRDGELMYFLAQFCFVDSKDLTGELPGDVLLVFAAPEDWAFEELTFEWYQFGTIDLVEAPDLIDVSPEFPPCYGHIYRTVNYPQATRNDEFPMSKYKYLTCRGREVLAEHFLFQYQATSIGRSPFYIQGDPGLPGVPLCTISSVGPDLHEPYPWVNRPEPLYPVGKWPGAEDYPWLQLGDAGCIYISIDEQRELHFAMDCF